MWRAWTKKKTHIQLGIVHTNTAAQICTHRKNWYKSTKMDWNGLSLTFSLCLDVFVFFCFFSSLFVFKSTPLHLLYFFLLHILRFHFSRLFLRLWICSSFSLRFFLWTYFIGTCFSLFEHLLFRNVCAFCCCSSLCVSYMLFPFAFLFVSFVSHKYCRIACSSIWLLFLLLAVLIVIVVVDIVMFIVRVVLKRPDFCFVWSAITDARNKLFELSKNRRIDDSRWVFTENPVQNRTDSWLNVKNFLYSTKNLQNRATLIQWCPFHVFSPYFHFSSLPLQK